MTLKLKFDASLGYQIEAVSAVVDLFEGFPAVDSSLSFSLGDPARLPMGELGFSNPVPSDGKDFNALLFKNLGGIQKRNDIPVAPELDGRNFSVEMETGTGKTYVYLRTIFELNKRYGFCKFVIVVPSIAIREGVLASTELMRGHFDSLFQNPSMDLAIYDSKHPGRVTNFAKSNSIQILVINIQAFSKDVSDDDPDSGNVINRRRDQSQGRALIELIQATNPIVIVDEPQNMESDSSVAAIERLNPLCVLRYSATHKRSYNLVYRLGPIDAFEQRLVKRIEVASVVADDNLNSAFVRLIAVDQVKARAQLMINQDAGIKNKQVKVWVKLGDDLREKSRERPEYSNGFIVSDVRMGKGSEGVEFTGGKMVTFDAAIESFDDDVRMAQVRTTIVEHLEKELEIAKRSKGDRLKVLSLFFLDRVASYRLNGTSAFGPTAEFFEKAYEELRISDRFAALKLPAAGSVHAGYFSGDSKKGFKNTSGTGEVDSSIYDLIMKNKERLLSLDEPVRFIFSHSALREGWDNPNVFQICTLNESNSVVKKRQEIGRGLRLPVNESGDRVHDESLNRLTVIANQSYESFARELQTEYTDAGILFGIVERTAFAKLLTRSTNGSLGGPLGQDASADIWSHLHEIGYLDSDGSILPKFNPADDDFVLSVPDGFQLLREEICDTVSRFAVNRHVSDKRKRMKVRFRKQVTDNGEFAELWNRISKRTKYRIELSSEKLVAECLKRISKEKRIQAAQVRVRTVALKQEKSGVTAGDTRRIQSFTTDGPVVLPDILAELQNETDLTRPTLINILTGSERLAEFVSNPQQFIAMITMCIRSVLRTMMVEGISYHEVAGSNWEMHRLEGSASEDIERYINRLYKVQSAWKTPYDHVEIDSEVERKFAKELDSNDHVKHFVKLPRFFTVDTPIGPYNPDWAIVLDESVQNPATRVYLVRETKSTLETEKLRKAEATKVECAQKHFAAIDVNFGIATNLDDVFESLKPGAFG
jgi:type III restriction enzyme